MDIFHLLDQLRIEKVEGNNQSGNAEDLEAKIKNLVHTEICESGESKILSLRSKIQYANSENTQYFCDYTSDATPLLVATCFGQTRLVEFFLSRGADINATDCHNRSALIWAADRGDLDTALCLIRYGADLEVKESLYESTALNWAAWRGRVEVVKVLVQAGAAPDSPNKFGDRAIELSSGPRAVEIVDILEEYERRYFEHKSSGTTILQLASKLDSFHKEIGPNSGLDDLLKSKGVESFKDFFEVLNRKEMDVALVFLYQLLKGNKDLQDKVQMHTEIHLNSFKSIEAALVFAEDIIKTGAVQERKTTVCVLGNTSAGKSSLVRTLEKYSKNTKVKPEAVLTGDPKYRDLIETKVMELVKGVELDAESGLTLKVESSQGAPKLYRICKSSTENRDKSKDDENKEGVHNIQISFVDFAGHSEYTSCSTLFMKKKGIFLICFDTEKLLHATKPVIEGYYPAIGTYMEIVTEKCHTPIFILTATKTDKCSPRDAEQLFGGILETAQEHLASISIRSNKLKTAFLYNAVVKTSAADEEHLQETLRNLCAILAAICDHRELMDVRLKTIPTVWKEMISGLKECLQVPVREVEQKYRSILQSNKHILHQISQVEEEFTSSDSNEPKIKGEDLSKWVQIMKTYATHIKKDDEKGGSNTILLEEDDKVSSTIDLNPTRSDKDSDESKQQKTMAKSTLPAKEKTLKSADKEEAGNSEKMDANVCQKVRTILEAFSADQDIFWFSDIPSLCDIVIPEPMKLIKAMRTIIRHDVLPAIRDNAKKQEDRKELLEKGIVTREIFEALHAASNEDDASRLTVDQTWEFLKKLKLATEMNCAQPSLYVPSLIPEKNQRDIIKAVEDSKKSPDTLGFYASFPKSDSVTDLYSKLLSRLASNQFFFKERNPGIRFDKSFSAKIENRTLGIVAGTKGSLAWEGGEGSRTIVDFILVEIDCDNTRRDLKFARDKGICVYIRARSHTESFEHFNAIKVFDGILVDLVPENDIERYLPCPTCMVKGKDRFFSAVSGFEPKDELELCQSLHLDDIDVDLADEVGPVEEEHSLDERQRSLTGRSYHRQVSTLHEFIEDGIQSIEKVPFSELRKDLRIGDQIWIYRDRRTNPCNPVAVLMPYAHVAVFVGDDKVVHVTKAPCSTGILTATIKKVPIDQVIKPYDKVFLGHKIPAFRHAINTRDKIAAKANALAQPPYLVFDYDRRDNCEAFANLLIGAADLHSDGVHGVLGYNVHPCVAAVCCLVDCFRGCKQRISLREVVQRRLNECCI